MSLDIRPALDAIFDALGVEATVTPPDSDPIETTVVWLTPATDAFHVGPDSRRRSEFIAQESFKVLELRKDDVPTTPRGTQIDAAEMAGGEVIGWRVEETVQEDAECRRVIVIARPDAS